MGGLAVIGGGGWVGGALFQALNRIDAAYCAISHSAEGVRKLGAGGVSRVLKADMADQESLRIAFDSIDVVYAIPPALHPREDELMMNVIRAAEISGVSRLVYHSVLHANTPFLRNHQRKARVEAALKDSALRWTILQPSMYAQAVAAMFGSQSGTVRIPFDADARVAVVDLADCAEVAQKIIYSGGVHDYATYELAGPTTTMRAAVATMALARGVELAPEVVDVNEGPIPPGAKGNPESAADMVSTYAHYHNHGFPGCGIVLKHLLGREPTSFQAFVAREFSAQRT